MLRASDGWVFLAAMAFARRSCRRSLVRLLVEDRGWPEVDVVSTIIVVSFHDGSSHKEGVVYLFAGPWREPW